MMQGPIQRTVRHRVEPRADARLPTAWIGGNMAQPPWTDGTWLTRTPGRAVPAGNAPALVLLGNGGEDARAALLAHAAAGARVYALVGPGWGKDQADSQVLQAPRVLIRRLAEVPASAVHAGTEARLWIGGGFILRLDPTQAEALRQTFLRLFWHEATEEAWSGGRQFAWRPARERPFDVPEVPASASLRWEPADARLSGDTRGALMHVSAGLPTDQAPRRLWFSAGPVHHERLAKLAQAGVEVLWADRGLPDLQVNGGAGEVLLPGTCGRLRVRLTAHQAPEVARLLEAPSAWRFQANVRLGEAAHRAAQFWLPGEVAARGLETEQLVEVPDVSAASLREVPDTSPATVPTAQPLALAVRYQWTVVPPRVPTGAEDDALVGRWRKLDEDWTARLARVREALVAAEGDRGRIGRAFSRLVSAMLGFERTHGGLLARVSTLEAQRPSAAGPTGAPALLDQLSEVEADARKLQVDLSEAERKARDDQEREKQEAEWRAQVKSANQAASTVRAEVVEAEKREVELVDEAKEIEDRLRGAKPDENRDLDVRLKKNSDEQEKHAERLKGLRQDLAKHEDDAARSFTFNATKVETKGRQQQGQRFVPIGAATRSSSIVPEDALPEVGVLRTHKGQRYLVIDRWAHLDVGEKAASRLAARLVAPEDT
jgi:hypothetical protein